MKKIKWKLVAKSIGWSALMYYGLFTAFSLITWRFDQEGTKIVGATMVLVSPLMVGIFAIGSYIIEDSND